jgi:hypothetical protein
MPLNCINQIKKVLLGETRCHESVQLFPEDKGAAFEPLHRGDDPLGAFRWPFQEVPPVVLAR